MTTVLWLLIALSSHRECDRPLERAYEELFRQNYQGAEVFVLHARACDPSNLRTYELRTTTLLLWAKHLTEEEPKKSPEDILRKCGLCSGWHTAMEADLVSGIRLAEEALKTDPGNPEIRYLRARLRLNWAGLNALEHRYLKASKPFREGRRELEALLRENPRHVQALTVLAYVEYKVDQQNFLVRPFLGGGSKGKAFRYLALAIVLAPPGSFERADAQFALLDILDNEKRYAEGAVLAAELAKEFPENPAAALFLKAHPLPFVPQKP